MSSFIDLNWSLMKIEGKWMSGKLYYSSSCIDKLSLTWNREGVNGIVILRGREACKAFNVLFFRNLQNFIRRLYWVTRRLRNYLSFDSVCCLFNSWTLSSQPWSFIWNHDGRRDGWTPCTGESKVFCYSNHVLMLSFDIHSNKNLNGYSTKKLTISCLNCMTLFWWVDCPPFIFVLCHCNLVSAGV